MAESVEKQWYVVHTYAGYENKVKSNLESRAESMGMENNIFRVVVPEEEKVEKTKTGKEKIESIKTFPGYVLVEMVMSDQAWYVVRNTPGVTGFIGSHGGGSKPAPLLEEEVATILHSQGMSTRHDSNFDVQVGDTVAIVDGAFTGQTIKVTEVNAEKMKVKGIISMMGHENSVDVNFDQIDKLI